MKKIAFIIVAVAMFLISAKVFYAEDAAAVKEKGEAAVKEMKDMPAMKHGMLKEGKGMSMGCCSLHSMMMKGMMGKTMVATSDGGVVILTCHKLMKYDKDLNLVKEIELKMDMEGMKKMMTEMKEKCPQCQRMQGCMDVSKEKAEEAK